MKRKDFSRREFLGIGAAAAGVSLAGKATLPGAQLLEGPARTVPASDRVRFGMIGVGMQGSGLLATSITAAGRRMRRRLRPLRRPPHAGQGDRARRSCRYHAALSGAARQQGHRLHRGRRPRSLAQADRGRRGQRRQGHLLREADVAHRRRRLRDGGRGEEERAHRPDRLAARQLR